jgi:hypothetical protein
MVASRQAIAALLWFSPTIRQQHGRIAAEHFVEHLVLTPLLLVRLHQAQVPIRHPGPPV